MTHTIVSPAAAQQQAKNSGEGAGIKGAPSVPPAPSGDLADSIPTPGGVHTAKPVEPPAAKPQWKFVKNFGVADVFKFKDGTSFSFRLIQRNNGAGYAPNSYLVTDDKALAENLRAVAKNPATGVVEVKI